MDCWSINGVGSIFQVEPRCCIIDWRRCNPHYSFNRRKSFVTLWKMTDLTRQKVWKKCEDMGIDRVCAMASIGNLGIDRVLAVEWLEGMQLRQSVFCRG